MSRHARNTDSKWRAIAFALLMVLAVAALVCVQDAFQTHTALPIAHHVVTHVAPHLKPNTGRIIAKAPSVKRKAVMHAWHVHHLMHMHYLHVHHLMHLAYERSISK